jgi:hypothetical protein
MTDQRTGLSPGVKMGCAVASSILVALLLAFGTCVGMLMQAATPGSGDQGKLFFYAMLAIDVAVVALGIFLFVRWYSRRVRSQEKDRQRYWPGAPEP